MVTFICVDQAWKPWQVTANFSIIMFLASKTWRVCRHLFPLLYMEKTVGQICLKTEDLATIKNYERGTVLWGHFSWFEAVNSSGSQSNWLKIKANSTFKYYCSGQKIIITSHWDYSKLSSGVILLYFEQ